jgi:hypothetical protein
LHVIDDAFRVSEFDLNAPHLSAIELDRTAFDARHGRDHEKRAFANHDASDDQVLWPTRCKLCFWVVSEPVHSGSER